MSAFVVHTEHINVLIWAGLQDPRLGALRWQTPRLAEELQPENASEVGQVLLDANVAAVNYMNGETSEAETHTYRPPRHRGWTGVELLNALHCYRYQADEHPDWEGSQAQAFVEALESRIVHRLPGYTSGPWAITPHSIPAAAAKRTA